MKATSFKALILSVLIFLGQPVFASEVDSFNKRYTPISDSLDIINKKTNELFQNAINEANVVKYHDEPLEHRRKFKACDEKRLYKSLRKRFRNHVFGELSPWIIKSKDVEKINVPIRDSIYADFKWYQAIIPGFYARISDPSGELLKMGPYLIGTDKFEHFMGSGFFMFRQKYLKGGSTRSAIKIGWKSEVGYMGLGTTGVLSYGDMVADFNGMRFWNHVLQKEQDVMGAEEKFNIGPYIICENEEWKKVKTFNWLDYLDHGYDEGINCSKYKNQSMLDSVEAKLSKLEDKENREYHCPLYPEKLKVVASKYKKFQKWLINLNGHQAVKK